MASPVLRVGFSEVYVTGMLTRRITVKARPIAIGANPPNWQDRGRTYADIYGYHVVIQNASWEN